MTTIKEFLARAWYCTEIIVVSTDKAATITDIETLKRLSVYAGYSYDFLNDRYSALHDILVGSFGIIENNLVIYWR